MSEDSHLKPKDFNPLSKHLVQFMLSFAHTLHQCHPLQIPLIKVTYIVFISIKVRKQPLFNPIPYIPYFIYSLESAL